MAGKFASNRAFTMILSIVGIAGILAAFVLGLNVFVTHGGGGDEREAGIIYGDAQPANVIIARQAADQAVAPKSTRTQILFGDLHVHTTNSADAFLWSLPILQGQGVYPVADACDYARYCSAMDFWSITDHAEASTPLRWSRTKESIRQCQLRAADQDNPDMVSFIGFEWTQVGVTPETHYGHKNIIFKTLKEEEISARPIGATGIATNALRRNIQPLPLAVPLLDYKNYKTYLDFNLYLKNTRDVSVCDDNTPSDQLPPDCYEAAATPSDLVRKLVDEQKLDPLIIPHGNSWGFYTPTGSKWNKQLTEANRPEWQELIEVFSGHGNSEEFRNWVAFTPPDEQNPQGSCPARTENYTPPCVRMGEIIEERCLADGTHAAECSQRAAEARQAYGEAGNMYHLLIGGETPADWLDSGQCTNCYLPAFNYRPLSSVQAGLATSDFEKSSRPSRFHWGFIASSDNHRARPGTGYKEVDRKLNTESTGPRSEAWARRLGSRSELAQAPADAYLHRRNREEILERAGLATTEFERQSGFWLTGGLAAVHTHGRSREAIWEALKRRETYGTSGQRMLLWFHHTDNNGRAVPMGSQVQARRAGTFKVRAVGSFRQKPGCPDYAFDALGKDRVQKLCGGECYNPSDKRHLIERIEIVRIRPQAYEGEPLADLIEDPYLVHHCKPDQSGCDFTFSDPDFSKGKRDTVYYARAIQEPQPTINGDALNCERGEDGRCIKVNLCYGDYRSGDSECTDIEDVRAWSSPIYLNYQRRL